MCGIAGLIRKKNSENTTAVMGEMLKTLQHRGPDGEGVWSEEFDSWSVALGHRRLSIIDLEGGVQPLSNEDDRYQITFNGEIFNFLELLPKLKDQGHTFRTRSDTEVIVHHFEQNGINGLTELNGMFAFGLWDQHQGELLLVRDRAGIKPLYYAPLEDGGVIFASELSTLLVHPSLKREISQEAMIDYFFSDRVSAPATMLKGIYKLPPAHFVRWKNGRLSEPQSYWSLESLGSQPTYDLTFDQALAELRSRLQTATRRNMIADVPVGIFLSGGIDSSLVTALAAEQSSQPLQTFSVTFEDPQYDEGPAAQMIAHRFKTVHRTRKLNEGELLNSVDSALNSLDEPIADASILPTYLLAEMASRHVKVVLGGDGGDELWAGYPTYKAHRLSKIYDLIPTGIRSQVIRPMVQKLPTRHTRQSFEWKLKRFAGRWDDNPNIRHLRWMSNLDLPDLKLAFVDSNDLPLSVRQLFSFKFSSQSLNHFLALDFSSYMVGNVLTKVDRASMAHSLEVRPPLLDNDLIELAYRLPFEMKLHHGKTKHIIKELARDLLPREILGLPKKGFGVPMNRWVQGPLKKRIEVVLSGDSPVWTKNLLSRSTFQKWFQDHIEVRADHGRTFWALIVLDHWMKKNGIH